MPAMTEACPHINLWGFVLILLKLDRNITRIKNICLGLRRVNRFDGSGGNHFKWRVVGWVVGGARSPNNFKGQMIIWLKLQNTFKEWGHSLSFVGGRGHSSILTRKEDNLESSLSYSFYPYHLRELSGVVIRDVFKRIPYVWILVMDFICIMVIILFLSTVVRKYSWQRQNYCMWYKWNPRLLHHIYQTLWSTREVTRTLRMRNNLPPWCQHILPSHWIPVEEWISKPVGWTMCFLLTTSCLLSTGYWHELCSYV